MTELSREQSAPASAKPVTVPLDYPPPPAGRPETPSGRDCERREAEDALTDAEAAEAAAVRKVRIAEAVIAELAADAKDSARLAAQDRLETATNAYEAAETRTRRARSLLATHVQQSDADDPTDDDLAYPNADAWLRSWLLPNWRRPVHQHWCPKWWLHAEAVSRVEAMWRAWEHLRTDGALGPSAWWRDHGDYHLAVLTSSTGPFARCNYRRGVHQQEDLLPAVVNPLNFADFVG